MLLNHVEKIVSSFYINYTCKRAVKNVHVTLNQFHKRIMYYDDEDVRRQYLFGCSF